jgi:gamma-glutamyltranspeptidase
MFCLYYDAKTKKVSALNGSGRSGGEMTLEKIRKDLKIPDGEMGHIPMQSVHAATVPGAAAGWTLLSDSEAGKSQWKTCLLQRLIWPRMASPFLSFLLPS